MIEMSAVGQLARRLTQQKQVDDETLLDDDSRHAICTHASSSQQTKHKGNSNTTEIREEATERLN